MKYEIKTVKEYLRPDSETPDDHKAYALFREPTREILILVSEALQADKSITPEIEAHVKKRLIALHGVELECDGDTYAPAIEDWYNWPGELVGEVIGAYYRAVNKTFLTPASVKEQEEKNA